MNYKSFLTDTWTKFSQLFSKFVKKTFVGTRAEWDLLSVAEKKQYDLADFTDDTASGVPIISDVVTAGDMNAVTSNAVFEYMNDVETISLTPNTGAEYRVVELKAVRTGNVVSVAGIVEVLAQIESKTVATGFPTPLITKDTVNSTQFFLAGQRATNDEGQSARIDKDGNLVIYTSTSGGNYYFSGTYITEAEA